jgi:tetratricopeptide (TPR) repeat protein
MRTPPLILCAILILSVGARPAPAQEDPLSAVRRTLPADPAAAKLALQELLRSTVAAVGAGELMLARSLEEADTTRAAEQKQLAAETLDARRLLVALLDTIVFRTEWGAEELGRFRRRYPTSVLFLRYEADLASRGDDPETALAIYDRLLGMRAADAGLQVARAEVLEQLGRRAEAIAAYTRALELAPADEMAFRALVRLRQENGTLPALLEQVRRLRTLYPNIPGLDEREVEVLHRLGRGTETGIGDGQPSEDSPW